MKRGGYRATEVKYARFKKNILGGYLPGYPPHCVGAPHRTPPHSHHLRSVLVDIYNDDWDLLTTTDFGWGNGIGTLLKRWCSQVGKAGCPSSKDT